MAKLCYLRHRAENKGDETRIIIVIIIITCGWLTNICLALSGSFSTSCFMFDTISQTSWAGICITTPFTVRSCKCFRQTSKLKTRMLTTTSRTHVRMCNQSIRSCPFPGLPQWRLPQSSNSLLQRAKRSVASRNNVDKE